MSGVHRFPDESLVVVLGSGTMGRVIARIAAGFYGEPRYRPSPLLRRVADTSIKIGEAG